MTSATHTPARLIRDELQHRAAISLARFIELALYSPECGYYEFHDRTIGRTGDFFTSVSVGPVFGQVLATSWSTVLSGLGDGPTTVLEAGAHHGRLALDVLNTLQAEFPDLYARTTYVIAEPSPTRQSRQQSLLQQHSGRVQWIPHLQSLPPRSLRGVLFSNELLDAFPIHQLRWNASSHAWEEWGVGLDLDGESFVWRKLNTPSFEIPTELQAAGFELTPDLEAVLPDGFILEVSPAAREWWRQAASVLDQGWLQAIDYGFEAGEMLMPERGQGSLRAYRKHQVAPDVLSHPGEQDLTAHVNWTAIQKAGEAAGLHTTQLVRQSEYLVKTVARGGFEGKWNAAERRQFQTLVHPQHLGHVFRVLIQTRSGME